ncbi:GyrI-like domain-containing protein [Paractinoplanes brasiliensis]|uniref:AraC effector-binding domain-containing protein n=1 Tax=Paractinoplanes brasiliensis TaxID=52695 RepID=A0A4R6JY37_9ACTN|nr:GyrI-like domain-containing protein [Actinoplanes brasiliensis]TDO39655.1 hypothetical protein C8E87_3350 [Actinoplanes brasiliensis]GID29005.1 hypothetical protein Abr02nite_39880 [Actinoplanes brasiliensis]
MHEQGLLDAGVAPHDAEVATSQPVSLFGIRGTVKLTVLRSYPQDILPVVASALQRLRVQAAGPPVCVLRPRGDGQFDVLAAYPTSRRPRIGQPFTTCRLSGGLVVRALHHGPWTTLLNTYDRLSEWLALHHIRQVPLMWEEYLVGPDRTGDPAMWRTRIVVPLTGTSARITTGRSAAVTVPLSP